jgi:hypothetical protein
MLCIESNDCRSCSLRESTCCDMWNFSQSSSGGPSGVVMIGGSSRIRVPLEISVAAMRPLPFPGTSVKEYIEVS